MSNNSLASNSLSSDEINKIEEFRKSKQTAVLAILFSDIVNSTYATEKLGEQTYSKLRHIHDELFKKIMCRDKAGIIIKEIGDSFLCVFAEPSTAVLRSIEFQRAINSNKEHLTILNYTLTVRIGIHVGQVAVENSLVLDIFGRHVNRAARIESLAGGGQIFSSLSVWENAVGWIKDSNEDKIGWISHGKTKLKGVEEKVEIFEFYSKDINKPSPPTIIRKRRRNQLLLLFLGFVVVAGLSFFILKEIGKEIPVVQNGRKTHYVQFDFSGLSKEKSAFDSIDIAERLLSQAITLLSPDSVITEIDLIRFFSKKGELYKRHSNEDDYNANDKSEDDKYFRDTLKFASVLLVSVKSASNNKSDFFDLKCRIVSYPDLKTTLIFFTKSDDSSLKMIAHDFRKIIQHSFIGQQLSIVQGYVLTCNDNEIIFRLSKDAKLREGAIVNVSRNYSGKEGLYERLEYLKARIDYFKNRPNDSLDLKDSYEQYASIENSIPKTDSINNNAFQLEIRGRVKELYDSTGKATWKLNGKFPFDKPKKGDLIKLAL